MINVAQPQQARTAFEERPSPPTLKTALLYSVASFGAGLFYGFNNATLPLILSQFTQSSLLIGLMSSTRSIEGTVVQPFVGAWSDRIWTRFGRRRPFILVAIPLSSLFFLVAAYAPNLVLLVAAIFLFSLLFNVAADPLNALLADLFPPDRRSAVNGLSSVIQFAGTVAVLLGAAQLTKLNHLHVLYFLVAAGMLLTAAVTFLSLREPRALPHATEDTDYSERLGLRHYVERLPRHRDAFLFLVCLFCYNFGVNAILPYLTLFAVKVIHTDDAAAEYLFLALVLATGLILVPAGLLATRIGRRPVLAAGLALMGATALAGLVVQDVPQTLVVIILAGIANAAITATNWPLLSELVPPGEVGVFAGLKTAFESVAIPVSVLISSVLIDRLGYRSIFVVLTIGAVGAFVLLRTVKSSGAATAHIPNTDQ